MVIEILSSPDINTFDQGAGLGLHLDFASVTLRFEHIEPSVEACP